MSPPPPIHVFRSHAHALHSTAFSADNQLLYAGDEEGWVTITDLRTKRVVAHWRAHEAGVLAVGDWQGGLVSHGRDNIIHFHEPLNRASASPATAPIPDATPNSAARSLISTTAPYRNLLIPPRKIRSLPVNALNFCGFHMVPIPTGFELDVPAVEGLDTDDREGEDDGRDSVDEKRGRFIKNWEGRQGLLAVPNLTDSETIDIYHVPSFGRLHAAVGTRAIPRHVQSEAKARSGLVMSTRLYFAPPNPPPKETPGTSASRPSPDIGTPSPTTPALHLVAAFEDGRVEHWQNPEWQKRTDPRLLTAASGSASGEGGGGWTNLWTLKGHNEAIMAMSMSPTLDYAYTVSADHQVVKYDLQQTSSPDGSGAQELQPTRFATKQIGNAAVAVSPDGKVVAVGGWDGSIRLFSARTFKPLGTLVYHRQTCHTIAFPHKIAVTDAHPGTDTTGTAEEASVVELAEEDDDSSEGEEYSGLARKSGMRNVMRWMASGGKDRRLALWELKDFSRG